MNDNTPIILKGMSILFALAGALAALLWQDARQSIALLEIDVKNLDKRLTMIETNYTRSVEDQNDFKGAVKEMSKRLARIEKGLISRRIIKPN